MHVLCMSTVSGLRVQHRGQNGVYVAVWRSVNIYDIYGVELRLRTGSKGGEALLELFSH